MKWLIIPVLLAVLVAPAFALSPPYPSFTNWTDTANGITYVDAGYTHAIVRDADGIYWFALRRLYNNPTSVYELFTSANNGSSWSSVGTYDTGQDGGCLADLRMYTLDNEIYIDTWCGGNFIYHVNKTNAQVIASHGIGFQGACGTNSTNLWCISSVGSNFDVTIFDKNLNILDSFTAPKPTGNDGGIGGIQFNQKEDLAEFIFWDGFSSAYYANITSNPVRYATHDFLNPSFESTQSDSSNGRLNPFNAVIPMNWFTDNSWFFAEYNDTNAWANITGGDNIHVTENHSYAGAKSLEFNITDMGTWSSNSFGIASEGGLNLTAQNNYILTYYIEKSGEFDEITPCLTNTGQREARIAIKDTDASNELDMYICNSTDILQESGTVFVANSFSYTNVTGTDGHTWEKRVLDFNVTANTSNVSIVFTSTILGSGNFTYFADDVSIRPITTRGYSTNTNTFAAEHGWDDNFLAFKNGKKFLVAGTAYKQSADGTIWSGNFFPNPTNPYSKAAMLEDVGHNDTFIIYSNGAALYYMESEDYGVSFGSPVAIIDSPSQDYRVQVRGSSYPSYNSFGSHTGYLDMIVGAATNNDAFFVPLLHEDTLAPEINIQQPNGSVTSPISINYMVVSETGSPVDSCWYALNVTVNVTLSSCSNTTLALAVGNYSLTIYANDTASNIGSSVKSFSVVALPVPPPAPITGATAGIIGFLPLLIGVGIVVMAVRRIEDMESMEDFVAVIIGLGLGIAFLGVFVAIVSGLI